MPASLFYSGETVDSGISDFVGSAPGTFTADAALSERPLTTAEVATATTNGRPITYVPFAATPVAIVTLVPTSTYDVASPTIVSSDFCQHIPLSVDQLGGLFGYDSAQPYAWGDARIQCNSTTGLASYPVTRWANLDPTMENQSVMALLDSEQTSKGEFDAGLQQAVAQNAATTTDDTPSEHWPFSANTYPQGDESLIEHMVNIDPRSNVPSTDSSFWHLGAIAPISSEWTGAPLGAQWNFPTAAVENAASANVAPSVAAAQAAENSTTLATDNTVTFNPNTQDATAYNNYLMLEDYLVVPTAGLDAAKDKALAQFIRFVIGYDRGGRPREVRVSTGHPGNGDGGLKGRRRARPGRRSCCRRIEHDHFDYLNHGCRWGRGGYGNRNCRLCHLGHWSRRIRVVDRVVLRSGLYRCRGNLATRRPGRVSRLHRSWPATQVPSANPARR